MAAKPPKPTADPPEDTPRSDFVPLGQWKRCPLPCGGQVKAYLLWVLNEWRRFWFCAACCRRLKGPNFPE